MSALLHQVERARRRLLANAFFERTVFGLLIGGSALAVAVIVDRTFGWGMPLGAALAGAGGLALLIAVIGTWISRTSRLRAAMAIDAAAGLKERLSTALACAADGDEFARAAMRDAETTAAKIHVPSHLPLRAPKLWPWSIASTAAAALIAMFMPTLNLFASDGSRDTADEAATLRERENITTAVNQQVTKLRQMAQENKQLAGLASDLKPLDLADKPLKTPDDVRREAAKQIDQMAQKLEEKKGEQNTDAQRELKRLLAGLKPQDARQTQSELSKAVSKGDFQGARKALENMKKELADAANKGDAEAQKKLAELQKKLDELSKQLAELPNDKQAQKELEKKAGLSPEAAKKMLDELSKVDPKQLEKELQKRLSEAGSKMTPEQMKKLAEKLAQNKEAQQACQKMAEAMQQAAQACQKPGEDSSQDAQAGAQAALESAAAQMSSMEMAEQMANELEAQLSELKDLRRDIAQGSCDKPGEGQSDTPGEKIGSQGPNYGLGSGSRIGEEKAAHQTIVSKEKTQRVGDQIVGQMLIDGPMMKGEAQAQARAAMSAEIQDEADAIERDEVPSQYHRALRVYFDRLAGLTNKPNAEPEPAKP